jgi:flagellar biosynthesis component FlhA
MDLLIILVIFIAIAIAGSAIAGKSSRWLAGPWGLLLYSATLIALGFMQNYTTLLFLGVAMLFGDAIWAIRQRSERRALKKALGE